MDTRQGRDANPRPSLPVRLSRFIGRAREITDLVQLLAETRLTTLVGAPGVGKTRLALQVAAEVRGDFAAGVWLVELGGLSAPDLLDGAVARALGLVDQPGRSMVDTLIEHLQSRRLLLVIDNCEHLVGSCATLIEALLHACPELHVLATSREALRIEGETTWRVPPLSVPGQQPPDSVRSTSVTDLLEFEAVQLFVDRARAVQPSFALADQNAGAVVQVCRRLDGIPLAIELAAARLDGLSPGQIAARLDDHLSLLSSGSRTALPRQQTLRGAIDWSYDLLSDDERTLLRRLAVFSGGWTLEAAEAVCGDGVLKLLLSMVNRSLVQTEERADEVRYRLLEMIRQYSREKLAAAGELASLHARHREWLLALAEQLDPERHFGPDEIRWLDRLEAEHDNLRAALAWGEQEPESLDATLRLAGSLRKFWHFRSHLREGRWWLTRLIARARVDPQVVRGTALASALAGAAQLAGYQGDFDQAVLLMEEALSIWRELDDQLMVVWALQRLGHYSGHLRQQDRALTLFEESVALGRELGDEPTRTLALIPFGMLLLRRGEYDRALAYAEEVLAFGRQLGDGLRTLNALRIICRASTARGDFERAMSASREAVRLARQQGHPRDLADTVKDSGMLAYAQRDTDQAAAAFAESLTIFHELGDRWGTSEITEWMAALACLLSDWARATRLFAAAEAMRDALKVVLNRPQADHDREVAAVRSRLGEAAFAANWTAGRAMSVAQAVEDALESTRPGPHGDSDQAMVVAAKGSGRASRTEPLTPRECEVAGLIARGFTNRQTAANLVISERTVDGHVRKILSKLEFATRAQIAVWATHRRLGSS